MGLVASMLQENVTNLKIECEVNPSQTPLLVPKISPLVFGGQHLILYARIKPNSQISSIKASWKIGEKVIRSEVSEKDCKIVHDSNFSFHRLAAKAQLKQWERDDDETVRDEIVNLSVASCVVSKSTAFVGVDQDRKSGEEKFYCKSNIFEAPTFSDNMMMMRGSQSACLKNVSSFGGGVGTLLGGFCFSKAQAAPPLVGFAMPSPASTVPLCIQQQSQPVIQFGNRSGGLFGSSQKRKCKSRMLSPEGFEAAELTSNDALIDIISSQKFDGSWRLEDCLNLIDKPRADFEKILEKISLNDDCFGTVLMLAFLEIKFGSREQEWKLVALKARKFLEAQNVKVSEVVQMCSLEIQGLI